MTDRRPLTVISGEVGELPSGDTIPAGALPAHATSHGSGGLDPVSPASIGAATSGHDHAATYQPLDSDLTAIAGLSPADGAYIQRSSGVWVSRSAAQTLTDLGAVPTTRTLTAGTGLVGGGDLSANRSYAVSYGSGSGTAVQGNDTRVVADQAAGTASIRTLGTGGSQAAPGNHAHAAYPLGVLYRGRYTSSVSTTGTNPSTARKITELPVTLTAGRLYRIYAENIPLTNSSTANVCYTQITYTTDGSTPATTSTRLVSASITSNSTATYVSLTISAFWPAASTQSVKLLLACYGTAGTTYLGGATDWPVELIVEDVGPDPGSSGTNF